MENICLTYYLIHFFISYLEYTHKNEIIDMYFDTKYLIIRHKITFI
jgi:hypothetical protein